MSPIQVHTEHYVHGYDDQHRFSSYWCQIEQVMVLGAYPVLEVGIGNGTVSSYLRRAHIPVTTVDLDRDLGPDTQGDILHLPFRRSTFGTVMACEVLEHLPFSHFHAALRELARVSSSYVIISLPNTGRYVRVLLQLPVYSEKRWFKDVSWFLRRRDVQAQGQHYWELEMPGYPRWRILSEIRRAGLQTLREFRLFENPYHHFFVLRKPFNHDLDTVECPE